MRCPNCQTENTSGAPFCEECGTRLSQALATHSLATGTLPQQTVLQDRYVVNQKLGQGGMGAVYRASDRRLSTVTWAIKEMSQSAITGPVELQQARDSFRHEAEMLAALNHPHLPRVTDHFEQDGKSYLVMEYVPGETLLSLLQREGLPQAQARVFDWLRQLSDALEYLHTQRPPIIFRDLKPANIMLTPNGQVKLIDFGIARLFKPGQAKDTQAFGTIGYSAPEQYGKGQTDARSDVYSLGVLVHQLLTGYDPAMTPFRLPLARQVNAQVPERLSDALSVATDNDPNQRFNSVAAFRAALTGAASQADRPPSTPLVQPPAMNYARPNSQPYPQPGSQPYGQPSSQPYGQPSSQPYGQPGSQPYGQPSSQPYAMAATPAPAQTTGMANGSRWVGIGSVAVMGLSTLMSLIAGRASNPLAGFAIILGFVALVGGVVALVMGVLALINLKTLQTAQGRRHAIIGIATGAASFLLCCVIAMQTGSLGNR